MGITLQQALAQGAKIVQPQQAQATNAYQSFVKSNITNAVPPPAAQPSVGDQINNAFKSGIDQIKQGAQQVGRGGSPLDLIEGVGKAGSGIISAAAAPLAPVINPTIGAATNSIADKLDSIPAVQKFANSPAGQATSRVAENVSNYSNIAGAVGGAMETPNVVDGIKETASQLKDSVTPKLTTVEPISAEAARTQAAQQGVKALGDMNQQVGGFKSKLGEDFRQGAANIEQAKPDAKLNLNYDQLQSLNDLKESKAFALPESVKNGTTELTPTQTQDLITQLNKSTFRETSSGLQVDQQRIALTNEIKKAASDSFGPEWNKVYSKYSQGITAVQKLDDLVSLGKDATASDVNKNLNTILKLGKTPEGKIILQNAIDEFKQSSGIDLTDSTKAVHQILDKQLALEEAQKPGLLKSAFDPKYITRRAVTGAISIGLLYPAIRAISKAAQGH